MIIDIKLNKIFNTVRVKLIFIQVSRPKIDNCNICHTCMSIL